MNLSKSIKKAAAKPTPRALLWRGPEVDGVTQGLLAKFLICRERFRLYALEGLRPVEGFNHRTSYGDMWHVCEEALAADPKSAAWARPLAKHAAGLVRQFPAQQEQIQHWYDVCSVQFPLYVDYWKEHPDVTARKPLYQEEVFDVPYQLPSGHHVRLRGKWDAVDVIGTGKGSGVYLQENKTKGDIREEQIRRQLSFDLQTMFYLTALSLFDYDVKGVRYNVVRRPLSGGKGTIVRHKPTKSNPQGESKAEYYERLRGVIAAEPETYFMRFKVEITAADLLRFRREFLTPALEQLYDWWMWMNGSQPDKFRHVHYRMPYGVYSPLLDGGSTELDEHLLTGSMVGLERVETLFKELG